MSFLQVYGSNMDLLVLKQILTTEQSLLDALISLSEGYTCDTTYSILQCFQTAENSDIVSLIQTCLHREATKRVASDTLLRENTLAVDILVKFLMFHSRDFLKKSLSPCIKSILLDEAFQNVEINPLFVDKNIKPSVIRERQRILTEAAWSIVTALLNSITKIPPVVKYVLGTLKKTLSEFSHEASLQITGSFYFLRILNPIIISPESVGITEDCAPDCRRGLVLISKLLQTAANGVSLDGSKESYMTAFDDLVAQSTIRITEFYEALTAPLPEAWLSNHSSDFRIFSEKLLSQNVEEQLRKFLVANFGNIIEKVPMRHLQGRHQKIQELKSLIIDPLFTRWSAEEVALWLESEVQLPEYKMLFKDQNITGSTLEDLTMEDMKNLGIEPHHMKQIQTQIKILKGPPSEQPARARAISHSVTFKPTPSNPPTTTKPMKLSATRTM